MGLLRVADRLNQALMVLAAFWGFILAVVITVDVVGRGLFAMPLTGSLEIVTNSIIVIAFLQLGYAVRSRSMLRADFLVHFLPGKLRQGLAFLGYLAGAFVFGLLVAACVEPAMDAWHSGEFEGEGALRVPTWPMYGVILLGSGLASLNYIILAWLALAGTDEDA